MRCSLPVVGDAIMSRLEVVMLMTPKKYHKPTAIRRAVNDEEFDPLFFIFFIHLAFIKRYRIDCDGSFLLRSDMVPKLFLFPLRRGLPGTAVLALLVTFLPPIVVVVAEGDDMVIFTFRGLLMVVRGTPVDWGAFAVGVDADTALEGNDFDLWYERGVVVTSLRIIEEQHPTGKKSFWKTLLHTKRSSN